MLKLKIINTALLESFLAKIDFDLSAMLTQKALEPLPVDYFSFYNSISTVYSSKIEGEEVDFDSYFKHKFLRVSYMPDYTKKADDLYAAYEFIYEKKLTEADVNAAHSLLSAHFLPEIHQGKIRNNPMFVINDQDRIEYVACDPAWVKEEWDKLFHDIAVLNSAQLAVNEVLYYASMIHLVFLRIHPFQDGNGRTARLIEKWFLLNKFGKEAILIESEKYYFQHKTDYYKNIKRIGLEYETLAYEKASDFLMMLINAVK